MKLGISSGSTPSLAPLQLLELMGQSGYSGVEWRVDDLSTVSEARPWHFRTNNRCTIEPSHAAMKQIRRECDRAGITIFALSPYVSVGDVSWGSSLIELAAEVGVPRLRLWASPAGKPYFEAFGETTGFIDALVPIARNHRVELAIEVHHGTICPSASMTMRVAERFDPEVVKVIYDIGNLAIEGLEDPDLALDLIGSHLAHVQIKNARYLPAADSQGWKWQWCPLEAGTLALPRFLSALQRHDFRDWLSIEDFCTDISDTTKLTHNHALINDYLNSTGASAQAPMLNR